MRGIEVHDLFRHTDARGWLLKAVKKEYTNGAAFGEIYVVGAEAGAVRANHYHNKTNEWFIVVAGKGTLTLADPVLRDEDRKTIPMGGEDRICVKIPAGIAHAIRNTGEGEMILLAFADRAYDPADPDTVPCIIDPPGED